MNKYIIKRTHTVFLLFARSLSPCWPHIHNRFASPQLNSLLVSIDIDWNFTLPMTLALSTTTDHFTFQSDFCGLHPIDNCVVRWLWFYFGDAHLINLRTSQIGVASKRKRNYAMLLYQFVASKYRFHCFNDGVFAINYGIIIFFLLFRTLFSFAKRLFEVFFFAHLFLYCRCLGWIPHTDTLLFCVFTHTMWRPYSTRMHNEKKDSNSTEITVCVRVCAKYIIDAHGTVHVNKYVQCSYGVLSPVFISNQIPLFMTVFWMRCVVRMFIVLSCCLLHYLVYRNSTCIQFNDDDGDDDAFVCDLLEHAVFDENDFCHRIKTFMGAINMGCCCCFYWISFWCLLWHLEMRRQMYKKEAHKVQQQQQQWNKIITE